MCWFDSLTGLPQCSTLSIVLAMFRVAARAVHQGEWFDPYGWRGSDRLMRRRLYDILSFAENSLDSMRPFVEQLYGPSTDTRTERIHEAASIIYGCLLRWERPWYRHPRWHIWHWQLQVHPLMHLKRWLFSRCAGCGRRFSYGYVPLSTSWDGSGPLWFRSERHVYHSECDPSVKRVK